MSADGPREVTMTARSINFPKARWVFPGLLLLVFCYGYTAGADGRWAAGIKAGTIYHEESKYAEAEKLYLIAMKEAEHFPNEDPRLSQTLNHLGLLYYNQGRYREAEPLY